MTKQADSLVIHPNPLLRERCREIGAVDVSALELGKRLAATMAAARGIGLAAPQIGISLRAVAVGVPTSDGLEPLIMYNPEIVWRSETLTTLDEGCLSIPGKRFRVERPDAVKVRFIDAMERESVATVTGIVAKCVQHEIDHLDGILILDRGLEVAIEDAIFADRAK